MKDITTLFKKVSFEDVESNIKINGTLTSSIDVCGFFLCKQGWMKVIHNNQKLFIKKDDLYIYTPSSFVSIEERSEDLKGSFVKCALELVLPFFERSQNSTEMLLIRENPCASLTEKQLERIERIGSLIHDRETAYEKLPKNDPKASILYHQIMSLAEAYFHEMLHNYLCNRRMENKPIARINKVFQRFMVSIMKNYKKEREVVFYAKEQYLSPRYFSTVVKEASGHTASEWIIRVVITQISQELMRSDKSIKEIAMDFNFPSQSFFGKYFKQYTGMSPKEYRRS